MTQPTHPMESILRMDRMPHIWFSGCGIGTVISSPNSNLSFNCG